MNYTNQLIVTTFEKNLTFEDWIRPGRRI